MANDESNPNDQMAKESRRAFFELRHSFVIRHFVIRH